MRPSSASTGFTLVELLVGLVILSVLVSLAAPAFNQTIAKQRLRAAANEMRTSIALARSEAVKRNVTTALTLVQRDSDWSNGWCVLNPDASATACADPTDGAGYTAGDYLSEVFLQEGVTVSEESATLTSVGFNNWGRTTGCPQFEFSTSYGGSTCTLCLSATNDGRVVAESAACGACPTGNQATNVWADACP